MLNEEKIRELCNNYTNEELRQCSGILTLAKTAGITPNEAIDILKLQGVIKFKNPNERRGRPPYTPEQKEAANEARKAKMRERYYKNKLNR